MKTIISILTVVLVPCIILFLCPIAAIVLIIAYIVNGIREAGEYDGA